MSHDIKVITASGGYLCTCTCGKESWHVYRRHADDFMRAHAKAITTAGGTE